MGANEEIVETPPAVPPPTVTIPATPPPIPPPPAPPVVEDDPMKDPRVQALVEQARQQEKDKLYPRLEELSNWKKETEARETEQQEKARLAQEAAEQVARQAAEEEMSAKELLAAREAEWNSRFAALQTDNEMEKALRQKESELRELDSYKARRLQEESENIMPALIEFVRGSTEQEIEASIAQAITKSNEILEASTNAMQAQRQQMPGTRITTPPVGPSDTESSTIQLTPDQIRNMSMEEYAKHRDTLLGAASDQAHGRG